MIWRALVALKRRLAIRSRWREQRDIVRRLGWKGVLVHRVLARYGSPGSVFRCHPATVQYPLHARARTSDRDALRHIFLRLDYEAVSGLENVGLVIDCGANVGYSAALFLSRYPQCELIAVEPDPENFAMLRGNLEPYGRRVTLVQAGVWCDSARLVVMRDGYRDGRHWAAHVRPCRPAEPADFEGVTIASLLARSGHERISLLKIDVEGAETVLFNDDVSWLEHVDALAIELHDDSPYGDPTEAFCRAMNRFGFDVTPAGENVIGRRRGHSQAC